MILEAGTTVTLRVRRETPPYGWFVGVGEDGGPDILLPYGEAVVRRPQPGDEADLFLFHDDKGRLTATQRAPLIRLGEMARLAVADFHPRFGYFLEMGIGRQLLLPLKQLPEERRNVWPQTGDELHVVMKHDKEGRMLARLAKIEDFEQVVFRAPGSWKGEWKEAWVTDVFRDGVFVLVEGGVLGYGALGFVHESAMSRPLRIGEKFSARVTQIREDGRVTLSMRQPKETGRMEDADRILAFLRERPGGGMPYSDETPADIIQKRFGLSKSAFKRALGKLMKDGLVTQKASWTYLEEASGTDTAEKAGETSRN
ncbi:MarR family transcriptional regulator [Cohnella pontilimi]|uniref:MarR family transcriptional regulator n=1 Tax=Cohnella pontilimi TaxID=2564100 RepID=A0A4U0FF32_9BACL|nr:S1-like domain-containing RNA-binding protein [Cohnella pontilimi]TJY43485.1 MarR family transcriptional regulator [Cohnella pontilimi]